MEHRTPGPVFLPVELDPSYLRSLEHLTAGGEVEAMLCGSDDETLDAMATDLLRCMPGLHLTRTTRSAAAVLGARPSNSVTILSPETWDATSPKDRERPDVLVHLSRFLPDRLAAHARSANWRLRADGRNRDHGWAVGSRRTVTIHGLARWSTYHHRPSKVLGRARCGRSGPAVVLVLLRIGAGVGVPGPWRATGTWTPSYPSTSEPVRSALPLKFVLCLEPW